MRLNSKGQVTIPAQPRAEHDLRTGDDIEVIEVDNPLRIARTKGAPARGQRLVRRLRGTADSRDIEGMSTDEIMDLLRG
ncbi:AbrB/MazE/SpoVT family DNA-binding domain-containing protein [Nocardia sp. NPDC005998]|uniref:AbrB/MazE/SpoVT family DNA-binding domain-containing protein n=1 Tax=Nocardia sp. NPDC005998 TaxID=3156894 RepID=UPI0033A04BA2